MSEPEGPAPTPDTPSERPTHTNVVTPWQFADALEAAGLIHDRERIVKIVITARPSELVTIRVTYLADDRLYQLARTATEAGGEGQD